jgi:N-acetylglucosamine-6-sulfatase
VSVDSGFGDAEAPWHQARYAAAMPVQGTTTGAWTRPLAAFGLATAIAAGLVGTAPRSEAQEAVTSAKRPNFVVITTDDQDAASLSRTVMPNVVEGISERGTLFTSGFASPPLCCPSRAGFITGQYPHNHGVFANSPGYPTLRGKADTLPKWLKRSGYRTGFVGKFLNGYSRSKLEGIEPAPGFDRWYAVHRRKLYYHYQMTINGRLRGFGGGKRDYLTKVITRYSKKFIGRESRKGNPFFLWASYWAPHYSKRERVKGPCDHLVTPGPGDEHAFRNAPLPLPPSFDEEDVSDKPPFIRRLPRINEPNIRRLTRSYRCRLASLLAVDRGVNSILKALKRSGELDDTVLVFTSDNGFYHGEHRITHGKATPYEPAIRVPLTISVPAAHLDGPRAAVAPEPVSNVDLAPTILDLAGASSCGKGDCRALDGRSLMPLLSEGSAAWPEDRAVLFETRTGEKPCRYEAIRTQSLFYAEHGVGNAARCQRAKQKELYDLEADPYELENLLRAPGGSPPTNTELALKVRLDALRKCSGVAGRDPGAGPACE